MLCDSRPLCDSGQQPTAGAIGLHWSRVNSRLDDHEVVIFKWLRYYQIPKQSQLVYLIDFDQLLMLIKSSETHAIFIILAVLVLKRVQRVLPKLHAKRTIIRTLTVTYGTLQKKQKVLRVKFTKTKASVSVFVFLI